MTQTATALQSLGIWLAGHRVELGLSLRVTVSAVTTLAVSHMLNLRIPLWAVLTAVILTQLSVGRSLRATIDYFTGTVGAAVYAGAVGALFPITSPTMLLTGLAVAVAPTTLLAALNPRISAAPFTAVLVFLAPTITQATPIESALERLLEVAVGGTIGLVVSLLILPARAHNLTIEAAGHMLQLMARLQTGMFGKFTQHLDEAPLLHLQDSIGDALVRLETTFLEAKQERVVRLTAEPDQAPLVRTLLRLRHDLIMVWRAALEPLPEPFKERLGPRLTQIGGAMADYLGQCARALLARRGPPPMDDVAAALDGYAAEMATLRKEGLTRGLSAHSAEHIFALGFALDQVRHHLADLARCVTELSARGRRSTRL
jgi:fusaric acid resistance family protein